MKLNSSISNSKIQFIINLAIVLILVFIGDRLISTAMDYLYGKYRPAQAANVLNAIDHQSNIVILGSSRAAHHYIPFLIEEKTGFSAYNLGQDGSNALIDLIKLSLLVDKYKPKLVIYDISAITFQTKPVSSVYPLYDFKPVKKIIDRLSIYNPIIFFLATSYKYNSIYLSLLKKIITPGDLLHGYVPLSGSLKLYENIKKNTGSIPIEDQECINYVRNIISLCRYNKIKLIFVNSPRLNYGPLKIPNELKQTELKYIDMNYKDYPEFNNKKYYRDYSHLNKDGALLFSEKIIPVIIGMLNK